MTENAELYEAVADLVEERDGWPNSDRPISGISA
jgi:hypothetical protein